MITKFEKSFPIVRRSTALILLSLAFPFTPTQNPNAEFIQMGIVIIQMIATECVASNRCHICGVSFEFKRQLRRQVNPFSRGQGLATDLTWTSCVYRSVSSRLTFERISRHETFLDLRESRATGNTYCEMSTLQMLSHWRLPKRETNHLGFLELFGFSVGLLIDESLNAEHRRRVAEKCSVIAVDNDCASRRTKIDSNFFHETQTL